jgi:hypothetical protein
MPEPLIVPFGTFLKPEYRQGLVGHWKMNVGSGMMLPDLSGNGNHGTLTNMSFPPTATSGWAGQGLSFDGVNDYVDIASSSSSQIGSGNFSISGWLNPTNISGVKTFYSKRGVAVGAPYNAGMLFWVNGAQLDFYSVVEGGSGWSVLSTTNANLTANTRYFISLTRSGSTVYIYVNGVRKTTSGSAVSGNVSNAVNTSIGVHAYGVTKDSYFNGLIDDVRIFNRALSADEIAHSCFFQEDEWNFGEDEALDNPVPIIAYQERLRK